MVGGLVLWVSFSALILLVRCQEEHSASKRTRTIHWHSQHTMRSRVCETVERQSVSLSVLLSVPLVNSRSGVFAAVHHTRRDINRSGAPVLSAAAWCLAANAVIVMLTAEGQGWMQTYSQMFSLGTGGLTNLGGLANPTLLGKRQWW